jgi:acyl-CoA thioesterase-2
MPQSTDELVRILEVEVIETGLYRGQQPHTTLQRVFGGQVLGQALSAAYLSVPDERVVHSLHAYFIRPGDPAVPIIYAAENLRDGRSFSARRILARQHGKTIFTLTASFQIDEVGPEHQDVAPPLSSPGDMPDFRAVGATQEMQVQAAREWAALEVRYVAASYPGQEPLDPRHPAMARVWMRTASPLPDDPHLHRRVLAYMSDLTLLGASTVPHVAHRGEGMQLASLDHAMWFHRPFRADEWLLYDQVSPSASGARGLSIGRIFDREGRLVATAVQEGLMRPRPTP